jgi:hypothetical protein
MKILKKLNRVILGLIALAVGFGVVILNLASTGTSPGSARMATFPQSPHYKDGTFINPVPTGVMRDANYWELTSRFLKSNSDDRKPKHPIPVQTLRRSTFKGAPGRGLGVYWLGHASVLLEMAGKRFLLDPVFSERASMVQWAGPQRLHPSPIGLDEIPEVDAVLISHNHYDHLDYATIQALAKRPVAFYVPLGIGETLESWGYRRDKIVELDWWGQGRKTTSKSFVRRPVTSRAAASSTATKRCGVRGACWPKGNASTSAAIRASMPTYRDIGEKYRPLRPHHPAHRGVRRSLDRNPHHARTGRGGAPTGKGKPSCCPSTGPPSTWPCTPGTNPSNAGAGSRKTTNKAHHSPGRRKSNVDRSPNHPNGHLVAPLIHR